MIQRMVTSALFAGFAAGLLAALLHFAFVQKTLLLGEAYEAGALTQPAVGAAPAAHDHADPAQHAGGHAHTGADPSATTRNALTVLFSALVYVAYALILVAGFALADHFGRRVTARDGLLWGIAGFAAVQLMPAMGLAPELPGSGAADLQLRQIWWWGTVLATATGLGLLAYGRGVLAVVVAVAVLAAPHIIGAPLSSGYTGAAPPELAAAFAARVLGVGLVVWAVLGWVAGWFWSSGQNHSMMPR